MQIIKETKPMLFVAFEINIFKLKSTQLMQETKMQKLNHVFFSLLKILKILPCTYNALYLNKLESNKQYKSIKLKQTG